MTETELKFLIAKPDLAKLWTLPALREWIRDAPARQSKTTYFDTVGRDLWKRGFILRIRSTDGYLIQTIKQDQSSLVDRGEWERQIQPPPKGAPLGPDLAMIEDTPLADAIDESIRAGLPPGIRNRRRTHRLSVDCGGHADRGRDRPRRDSRRRRARPNG
jgi:hypothetical protein